MEKVIIVIMILLLASIIGIPAVFIYQDYKHPCIASHQEMVHHSAWIQYIATSIGKTTQMTPIFHPSYDAMEVICDKRKE